jgi:hypothetical protein
MRAPLRSVFACSLALVLGLPGSALAAPSKSKSSKSATGEGKDAGEPSVPPVSHDGPPRVGRVFVDAPGISSGGAVLAGRAMRAATGGLQSQAVTITEVPAGPELRVKLSERDAGGYRVEYEIVYDGKTIKNGTGGFDCQLCTEDELIEKVEALAVQVSPRLVVPEPETEGDGGPGSGSGPDPEIDDGRGGTTTFDDSTFEPKGLRAMGKAGIGLLVVGGLGTIAGVVMVVRKDSHFDPGSEDAAQLLSTKKPGFGVLGGGAAVLVTGAVLLGLDVARAKRAKSGKAQAHVHPWLGRDGAGVGVVGRF